MTNDDAKEFLAEIINNYNNLNFTSSGIPANDANTIVWKRTLTKFYSYMEKV